MPCRFGDFALLCSPGVELRQLRYFIAIVEHGSFSRAANELGRTQQALSKAMQSLEEELGVRLLDRNAQIATPTAFGRLLLEHGKAIDGEARSFHTKLARLLDAEGGGVRIGAGPSSAGGLVTRAVLDLQRTRPGIRLDIVNGVHAELVEQLQRGRIDIAVCVETGQAELGPLSREVLGEDEYVIVCGSAHPLASRRELTVADLTGARWILGGRLGEVEAAWGALFDEAALPRPKPAIETTSLEFCRAALQGGLHLSVLTRGLIETELRAGTLCALSIARASWPRPVVLLYRRADMGLSPVLAVIRALHAATRASPSA